MLREYKETDQDYPTISQSTCASQQEDTEKMRFARHGSDQKPRGSNSNSLVNSVSLSTCSYLLSKSLEEFFINEELRMLSTKPFT
jgi:hypothetical protein